jgi:type I restriction enzyme M protein
MSKEDRHQLKKELWRACDVMRSDSNCNGARDYVEHLTWLLFLKFLDRRESPLGNHGNLIDERYRWKSWVNKFVGAKLPDGSRTHSVYPEMELMQFVRDELIPYLTSLSGTPERDVIASVFVDRNAVICNSPYNLKYLIAIIDNLDFIEEDGLDACAEFYEELLQKFGKEDISLGEFIVPPAIAHYVVKILNPQIGETVYDPSCGSGTFLVEAYKYLLSQEPHNQTIGGMMRQMLVGLEKKPVAALIGSMNMVLHGICGGEIRRQNALELHDTDIPQYFDVVITNPPFGVSTNATDQLGVQGERKAAEVLFVYHILRKLRRGAPARCGMIVPDGLLYRSGYFKEVRKVLTEQFNLSLIVSLPSGCFPYTSAKTSIIFFNSPGPTTEVLYYEIGSSRKGGSANKERRSNEEDFAEMYEVWNYWQAYLRKEVNKPILPENSWTIKMDELKERNYDLSARPMNLNGCSDHGTSTSELLAQLAADSRAFTLAVDRLFKLIGNDEEL